MGTFASIQTRVRTRLIDLPTAVSAEVPTLVNEAMKSIEGDHNFRVMEYSTTINTTIASRGLGAVPDDFKEFRGIPRIVRFDGSIKKLSIAGSEQAALELFKENSVGEPLLLHDPYGTVDGVRTFNIYPLPDGLSDYVGGEYRVVIPYWRYVPDLVGTASNWFTVNAEEYLVAKATSIGFALDWDEDRMTFWAQLADNERKLVIKRDKIYQLSKVTTLVPMFKGVNGRRIEVR